MRENIKLSMKQRDMSRPHIAYIIDVWLSETRSTGGPY